MALIVDFTGQLEANSFITIAQADAFHNARGRESAWSDLDDDVKAAALIDATDFLQMAYAGQWAGFRVWVNQNLDWPRTGVYVDGRSLSLTAMPRNLVQATAILALKSAQGVPLAPDIEPKIKEETVGPLKTVYADSASSRTNFQAVELLIAPLLGVGANGGTGGSWSIPLIRS